MSNLRCLSYGSSSGVSVDNQTIWSDTENIAYDFILTYGTHKIFGSSYSFHINVHGIRYFPELPIKDLINKDNKPTTPNELTTGIKHSISHLCVLFSPCVVREDSSYVGTNEINMCHQAQKDFCSIFVIIPQHKNGYLIDVPHKRKIVYFYNIVFDEDFPSVLIYMSQQYAEAMDMWTDV